MPIGLRVKAFPTGLVIPPQTAWRWRAASSYPLQHLAISRHLTTYNL